MAKKNAARPSAVLSTRRHMVPPTNVVKLMDEIGGTRTAAKLSVSTTLLYKAKKENAINQVVELAAANALATLGQPERHHTAAAPAPQPFAMHSRGDVAFFVTVAGDKADMFQRMAAAMGASVVTA